MNKTLIDNLFLILPIRVSFSQQDVEAWVEERQKRMTFIKEMCITDPERMFQVMVMSVEEFVSVHKRLNNLIEGFLFQCPSYLGYTREEIQGTANLLPYLLEEIQNGNYLWLEYSHCKPGEIENNPQLVICTLSNQPGAASTREYIALPPSQHFLNQ